MGSDSVSWFNKGEQFRIPPFTTEYKRPLLARHYAAILYGMRHGDVALVGNRQLRLLKSGFEIPVTQAHCEEILRKYK